MKSEEEIVKSELDKKLNATESDDNNATLAKFVVGANMVLMERDNYAFDETEVNSVSTILPNLLSDMMKHGYLSYDKLRQECVSLQVRLNREGVESGYDELFADESKRVLPIYLSQLMETAHMSEEKLAEVEVNNALKNLNRKNDPKRLSMYALSLMMRLMRKELSDMLSDFNENDPAYIASVQISLLIDMIDHGFLTYHQLYQEGVDIAVQLIY